jgi:hypothetical protein
MGRLISTLLAAFLVAACAGGSEPGAEPTRELPQVSYQLKNPDGGTVGTITSGAACDEMLLLADLEGRIYRLGLPNGEPLAPLSTPDLQPMAIAADCARQQVWVISPARPSGLRAAAIDAQSGKQISDFRIAERCFVTSASISGDELVAGGECLADPKQGDPPPAESYYRHRRNGFRVNTVSGETRLGLEPYESACIGAGACVGGAVAVLPGAQYAVLPTATAVGVYSVSGELQRTVNASSPLLKRDGATLPLSAAAEERVRWSARNSLLYRVFAAPGRVVAVHHRVELPPEWTLSSPNRPQFKAWANVYSEDGTPLRLDIALPELPMAFDGQAVFVVDYGIDGRQGAHEQVSVVRINVVDAAPK